VKNIRQSCVTGKAHPPMEQHGDGTASFEKGTYSQCWYYYFVTSLTIW
jgi:hypothetical protein